MLNHRYRIPRGCFAAISAGEFRLSRPFPRTYFLLFSPSSPIFCRMRLSPFFLAAAVALPAAAFDAGVERTKVMISCEAGESDGTFRDVCRSAADALRRAGREVVLDSDPFSADRSEVLQVVRVRVEDSGSDWSGGAGVGTYVGNRSVGADVDLIHSWAAVRVEVLDPASLEVVRTWELEEVESRPAVTAIGVGGRRGFLRIPVWIGHGKGRTAAARVIGERIATELILADRDEQL